MFFWIDKTRDFRQQLLAECPGLSDGPSLTLAAWVIQLPSIATIVLVFMSFVYTDEIHLLCAHALLINGLFTWFVGAVLPVVTNNSATCSHNVEDRPCEEMSIMTTLLFFSLLYDAHKPARDRIAYKQRGMFLIASCVLLAWALVFTGLFEIEEVMTGGAIGMFSAALSAILVFLVIQPYLSHHPVARYAAIKFGITQSNKITMFWRKYAHLIHDDKQDDTPWHDLHYYLQSGKRPPLQVPIGVVYEEVQH